MSRINKDQQAQQQPQNPANSSNTIVAELLRLAAEAETNALHAGDDPTIVRWAMIRDRHIQAVKNIFAMVGIVPTESQMNRWLSIYSPQ